MKRLVFSCLAVLALGAAAEAHTLDEYVQALRVGMTGNRLAIYLDLTSGVNIAAEVLRRVDSDADGSVSPAEAETYARALLADLELLVDDAPSPMSLVRVEVPTVHEIRDGQGVIRLEASAAASDARGSHRVLIRNMHMPSLSVYLANALLPGTPNVRIVRQTRDVRQQTFWLDYDIGVGDASPTGWLFVASAGLIALIWLRST